MYFIALLLFQKVPGFLRQSGEIDGFLCFQIRSRREETRFLFRRVSAL
jgi:hypothetical protein